MKTMTRKLAVIGPKKDVLPYLALGAAVCMTGDAATARKALQDFARQGHPVIMITDDLIREIRDTVDAVEVETPAAISALPGKDGTTSFSQDRIKAQVSKAIGFHISGY